jgi:hypothetical protein
MVETFWKGLISINSPDWLTWHLDKIVDAMAIGLVMNLFDEGWTPEEAKQ